MKSDIYAFMDEQGDYVVIVGTSDRAAAEVALRKTEEEWFGPPSERNPNDRMEQPIPFDEFSAADIFCGTYKGEEDVCYWGNNPENFFDGGKFTTNDGFIAVIS